MPECARVVSCNTKHPPCFRRLWYGYDAISCWPQQSSCFKRCIRLLLLVLRIDNVWKPFWGSFLQACRALLFPLCDWIELQLNGWVFLGKKLFVQGVPRMCRGLNDHILLLLSPSISFFSLYLHQTTGFGAFIFLSSYSHFWSCWWQIMWWFWSCSELRSLEAKDGGGVQPFPAISRSTFCVGISVFCVCFRGWDYYQHAPAIMLSCHCDCNRCCNQRCCSRTPLQSGFTA